MIIYVGILTVILLPMRMVRLFYACIATPQRSPPPSACILHDCYTAYPGTAAVGGFSETRIVMDSTTGLC